MWVMWYTCIYGECVNICVFVYRHVYKYKHIHIDRYSHVPHIYEKQVNICMPTCAFTCKLRPKVKFRCLPWVFFPLVLEARFFIEFSRLSNEFQGFTCLYLLSTGIANTCCHNCLLHGCWSYELMSSCFQSLCFTNWAIPSTLNA